MSAPDQLISGKAVGVPAIVLAAGLSTRMQQFKPLLPFGDTPMIRQVVESLLSAPGVGPVIVVTGHEAVRVACALAGCDVWLVYNPDYASGEMISSVKAGVRAISAWASAENSPSWHGRPARVSPELHGRDAPATIPAERIPFLVALGDQPGIKPQTIRRLIDECDRSGAAVAIPTYHGRRGHPILLSGRCAPLILELEQNQTLRSLIQHLTTDVLEVAVDDPAVCLDVDTPQDYRDCLQKWERQSSASQINGGAYAPPPCREKQA